MAKTPTMKFKRGDDFFLDFTLTDINHTDAIAAKAALDAGTLLVSTLSTADPLDPAAISQAEADLIVLQTAYDAEILVDISLWTIESQMRWCGELIETFTVDMTNASIGKFVLKAPASNTELWVPRSYQADIQFTRTSGRVSSQTFIIDVEKDITHG